MSSTLIPIVAASALPTLLTRLAAAMLVLCVAACTTRVPAPVEDRAPRAVAPVAAPAVKAAPEPDWRPQTYTVKRGDTLYAIALDHGLDYRELAAWNNIDNVNLIRAGQVLRITPPGEPAPAGAAGVVTAPLRTAPPVVAGEAKPMPPPSAPSPGVASARSTDDYKREPRLVKEPYSEQALRDVQRAAATPVPAPAAPAAPQAIAAAPRRRHRRHHRRPSRRSSPNRRPGPRSTTTGSSGSGPPRAGS